MAVLIDRIKDDLLAGIDKELEENQKFAEGYKAGIEAYFKILVAAIQEASKPAVPETKMSDEQNQKDVVENPSE